MVVSILSALFEFAFPSGAYCAHYCFWKPARKQTTERKHHPSILITGVYSVFRLCWAERHVRFNTKTNRGLFTFAVVFVAFCPLLIPLQFLATLMFAEAIIWDGINLPNKPDDECVRIGRTAEWIRSLIKSYTYLGTMEPESIKKSDTLDEFNDTTPIKYFIPLIRITRSMKNQHLDRRVKVNTWIFGFYCRY